MTDQHSSHGTFLKIGDGATPTESFTTIAQVKDIQGPGLTMETEETTNHDSAGWAEFAGTIKDGGEVTFDLNFLPADATQNPTTGLLKKYVDKIKTNFQLVFPTSPATTWTFSALVTKFEPKAPVKGVLGASVSMKISGAVGFTA